MPRQRTKLTLVFARPNIEEKKRNQQSSRNGFLKKPFSPKNPHIEIPKAGSNGHLEILEPRR
jgi:hypothetical protein